jgi:Mrp family chromosome partitioning ATPase
VPLTVFQSLPVDGVVIVTSPQELVRMVVEKAVGMAGMMHIPVLGIVENMSYFECPDCSGRHKIFGNSGIEDIAGRHGIENISKLPLDPKLAGLCDRGEIEIFKGGWLDGLVDVIL